MIKFTQLTEQLGYPPRIKARLSTLHSDIITYVIDHFENTNRYKTKVVSLLNTISHYVMFGNTLPKNWSSSDPFNNITLLDAFKCEEDLGSLFLHVKNITWDVMPVSSKVSYGNNISGNTYDNIATSSQIEEIPSKSKNNIENESNGICPNLTVLKAYVPSGPDTPKENLYIRPPTVPRLDTSKPWAQRNVNGTVYTIYPSLPETPITQSQISITTDVSRMTASDLVKLYPNCFIRTRASTMYDSHPGLTLDPDVGILIPIEGFTESQVKDNIVKYPHIFKLMRNLNGKLVSFYSHIEINGELHETLSIWDGIEDSKKIPKNSEFIKEYVVRRYLLERDIKHINHRFPMFGTLDPFLTLFTTPDDYIRMGYDDIVGQARSCVQSRVSYKYSRNPVMRMVNNE